MWHFYYVDKSLAEKLPSNNLTLEEYYNLTRINIIYLYFGLILKIIG